MLPFYDNSVRSPRGLFLPAGQPIIDWTNPITNGLVGCWVATGEAGNLYIRDLVTQATLPAVISGASPTITAGSNGMLAIPGSGLSAWKGFATSSQQPSTNLSWLWMGQKSTSYTGGGDSNGFFGGRYDNVGSNPYVTWGYFAYDPVDLQLAYNVNGSAQFTDVFAVWQVGPSCLLTTMDLNFGVANTYLNGQLNQTNTGLSTGAISYSGSPTNCIGPDPSVDDQTTISGFQVGMLWNRTLSPAEANEIGADPTAFLIYPNDQLVSMNFVKKATVTAVPFFGYII